MLIKCLSPSLSPLYKHFFVQFQAAATLACVFIYVLCNRGHSSSSYKEINLELNAACRGESRTTRNCLVTLRFFSFMGAQGKSNFPICSCCKRFSALLLLTLSGQPRWAAKSLRSRGKLHWMYDRTRRIV